MTPETVVFEFLVTALWIEPQEEQKREKQVTESRGEEKKQRAD